VTSFLFVTDLDHTLVGDDAAMAELNRLLEQHRQQHGTRIVYSTGRSPILYQELIAEKSLLPPDVLVCAVGTEIYYQGNDTPDAGWTEALSQQWERDLVVATAGHFTDLTPQPDTEQRPFKVSYHLTQQAAAEVVPRLEGLLRDRGLDAQTIYSGGIDLDILPRQANKGRAMTHVRQSLGIDPTRTVACGDSGNDLALFVNREEYGIIVGNARSELLDWHHANPNPNRYLATAYCAAGILEGLRHFGFFK
jgi:sucrose-6F-phosphate phosphohydrolase